MMRPVTSTKIRMLVLLTYGYGLLSQFVHHGWMLAYGIGTALLVVIMGDLIGLIAHRD